MTFCDTTTGNGVSFWTHKTGTGNGTGTGTGWTDRCGSWNSYLIGSKIVGVIWIVMVRT